MTRKHQGEGSSSTLPAKHRRSSSRVVHTGEKFQLRTDTLSLPGGPELDKDIVDHPGSVVIIPVTDSGEIVLIQQWRPAIGKYSIELPSGTREHGETVSETAERELREETGLSSDSMHHIGSLYPLTGYSTERSEVFLARRLERAPLPQDTLEDIHTFLQSLDGVWRLIQDNEIDDALTVAAMAYVATRWQDMVPGRWSASA